MTWWCAATDLPWSWTWRAYPGVWLFVIALWAAYWTMGRGPAADSGTRRRSATFFTLGVLLVWVALDWPLGTLGGGYLASAHALQFVLLANSAPALLLLGLRPLLGRLAGRAGSGAPAPPASGATPAAGPVWLEAAAHPATGLVGYNLILLATHFPAVVDGFMASQLGSFVLDLLWLLAGALLWLPVITPRPRARFRPPLQMGYLFLQTIPATLPAAFLTFADYPFYRLYELAPRVSPLLTAWYDQQTAGLIMKVVGDPIIWIGIAVIFFRWANAERRADREAQAGLPQGPVGT